MRPDDFFIEYYTVTSNFKKDDGFWVTGHEDLVGVPVRPGRHEKANHHLAEKLILTKYKECKIISVNYL